MEGAPFPGWGSGGLRPTQAIVRPVCGLGARHGSTRNREADRLFCYLFAGYLLYDAYGARAPPPQRLCTRAAANPRRPPRAQVPKMPQLMWAHHVVCIIGHLLGTISFAPAFEHYASAVIALELGSAACNLWCARPGPPRRVPRARRAPPARRSMFPDVHGTRAIYEAAMLVSNAVTLLCLRRWTRVRLPKAAPYLGWAITGTLVALRQWAASKHYLGFGM